MTYQSVGEGQQSGVDATLIAEQLLDMTGQAILDQDFEAFRDHFTMPTIVETFEGRRSLDTVDALQDAFRGACAHYHGLGVTDLVRNVIAAQYDENGYIRQTHECRVLAGAQLAQAPYAVYSKIVFEGGAWKIAESIYIVENAPMYTRALSVGSSRVREGQTQ